MPHTLKQARQQLRQQLRARRRRLTQQQQKRAADRLIDQLRQHPKLRKARKVALYLPSDGEIDPRPLLHQLHRQGIQCYLPVVSRALGRRRMHFAYWQPGDRWQRNRFDLQQPLMHRSLGVLQLDLICLPLVGFDADGKRLGMGGGFYDRYLAFREQHPRRGPWLIGLAHQLQQCASIPGEPWDIPLDEIVTDRQRITLRPYY